jgi:hypothetical protein
MSPQHPKQTLAFTLLQRILRRNAKLENTRSAHTYDIISAGYSKRNSPFQIITIIIHTCSTKFLKPIKHALNPRGLYCILNTIAITEDVPNLEHHPSLKSRDLVIFML